MSIESRLVDIRTYLEDIASTQRHILAELQRGNGASAQADIKSAVDERLVHILENFSATKPAQADGLPWQGFDDMTVAEVLAHAETVDDATRGRALAYERKNKKRTGVITALVNWNS